MDNLTHEHESCSTDERKSHHSDKTKKNLISLPIELKVKLEG